jgi:hypothetical protein
MEAGTEETIMPALLPIILTGSYLVLAAERIPQLDTDQTCHAAAAAATAVNSNEDVCKRDEHDARGELEQEWGAVHGRATGALRVVVEARRLSELCRAADLPGNGGRGEEAAARRQADRRRAQIDVGRRYFLPGGVL